MKLETVWPAVVLDDQVPLAGRRDAKNTAEWDVGDPQIVKRVKTGTLEKAMDILAVQIGDHPRIVRT